MNVFPSLGVVDSSVGVVREGYPYIARRCDRLGTDGFRTRLLARPVTCIRGAEAARLFYSRDRFTRRGALPKSVVHLLQDEGSVQALDGEAHRHRKQLFLHILHTAHTRDLEGIFELEWQAGVSRWQHRRSVVLHDEVQEVLFRTAAAWAGVPVSEPDVRRRTQEMAAMVRNAGSFGPANWAARLLRNRCESWAQDVIRRARDGDLHPPDGSALDLIANHRERDSQKLDVNIAAVELLNLLRPMLATSRFIVFAALALLRQPHWAETFAAGDEADLSGFVDEVRRLFPYFPLIGGRARRDFAWPEQHEFSEGEWVLLDLYGTNHDSRLWKHPEAFIPERFRDGQVDPNTLIPQGAGEYADDHRCPGEPATIRLMMQAVRFLTQTMNYQVPAQDFTISLRAMPALPHDGFVIQDVQPR